MESALAVLSQAQRESLLVKCWMSHDARWFMAVAREFGVEAAVRLNQAAAREEGKAEAARIARTLGLPPVSDLRDFLLRQEIMIALLCPELLDYEIHQPSPDRHEVVVNRCFAHENIVKAGIGQAYECGIFARVLGWMDALGVQCEMTPPLGKCMKLDGGECVYRFRMTGAATDSAA